MKRIIPIVIVVALAAAGLLFFRQNNNNESSNSATQPAVEQAQKQQEEPATTDTFNTSLYSLTDPASLWVIANKKNPLPISYIPADLVLPNVPLRLAASEQQMQIRKVALEKLELLFADAKAAGLQLEFGSGYRSAQYQKTLYDGYVSSMGAAEADRSSARPGHSEHQTGLALDFTRIDGNCHLQECFGQTPEGLWLEKNAANYGFILRYLKDKESITGYMYEPWHFRYVGTELATELQKQPSTTLEEFFKLGAAPDYL